MLDDTSDGAVEVAMCAQGTTFDDDADEEAFKVLSVDGETLNSGVRHHFTYLSSRAWNPIRSSLLSMKHRSNGYLLIVINDMIVTCGRPRQ
jgi:hypothetical protein